MMLFIYLLKNAPVNEHNENMLHRLNDTLVNINVIDEIPTAAHIPECDISAARNRKHTETGGLPMKLRLKLEAKVITMLISTIG